MSNEITSWLTVVDTGLVALQAVAYHAQGVKTSPRRCAALLHVLWLVLSHRTGIPSVLILASLTNLPIV